MILASPRWKDSMRCCVDKINYNAIVPETPFRMMIRHCPDLAKIVFDRCTVIQDGTTSGDDEAVNNKTQDLVVDYEFLDDSFNFEVTTKVGVFGFLKTAEVQERNRYTYISHLHDDQLIVGKAHYHKNGKVIMSNHPLMIMVEEGQMELLRDPVCMALLTRKWTQFGRYIYYGSLMAYAAFLSMLTTFALVTTNPGGINATCSVDSGPAGQVKANVQKVCQLGIIIMASLSLVLEVVHFVRVSLLK
jgi:hypothetical protein